MKIFLRSISKIVAIVFILTALIPNLQSNALLIKPVLSNNNQNDILKRIITSATTVQDSDAKAHDMAGVEAYLKAFEKFKPIYQANYKSICDNIPKTVLKDCDLDFNNILRDNKTIFNPEQKIEKIELLISQFKNEINKEYMNTHFNSSDKLFEIKQKLSMYAYEFIASKRCDDETATLFANALKEFIIADKIICKSNLEDLNSRLQNIRNIGLKLRTLLLKNVATAMFNLAGNHLKKGMLFPPLTEYRLSHLKYLEALKINGIIFKRVTGVELSKSEITLNVGTTSQLGAKVIPQDAYNKKLIWSTSTTNVGITQTGLISGIKAGTGIVTVITEDGAFKAECKVTVISVFEAPVLSVKEQSGIFVLTWNNSSGAVKYSVQKKIDSGIYKNILSNTTLTTFEDNDFSVKGIFCYRVIAYDKYDNSKESNEVVAIYNYIGSGVLPKDTDKDGLPDDSEISVTSTNPLIADTDGDGLLDGYEYFSLGTSPVKADTDGNGINDGAEDFDKDGLDNLSESKYNTKPYDNDSDSDGLIDSEEINLYLTNPNNEDTDGDGLNDGSEIKLGFNPLKPDTNNNGIIDSKEKIVQTVDQNKLELLNTSDNKVIPSVTVNAQGDINRNIVVRDAVENPMLKDNRAIVGHPIDIELANEFEYADIKFKIKDEVLNSVDIRNLTVCRYDKETGEVEPLNTTIDITNKTISTRVNHFSIYFVMNTKILDYDIGTSTDGSISGQGQADVVFVIDTTGSMSDEITNVKNNIQNFVDELNSANVSVHLGLIEYKDITYDGTDSTQVKKDGTNNWYYDVNTFKTALASLGVYGGGDGPESAVDALEEARRMDFRENAVKFIILLTDADYKVENRFGIQSLAEEISKLKEANIVTSVVTATYYRSLYENLFTQTNGVFADIYGNFAIVLNPLIDKIKNTVNDGYWIVLQNLVSVKLKKKPEITDNVTDSDSDGVADINELKSLTPKVISYSNNGVPKSISVYECNTNPAVKDTDGDGANDADDILPNEPFKNPVMLLHGRTDNSYECWGIENSIAGYDSLAGKKFTYNNTFIDRRKLSISDVAEKVDYYTKPDNQRINEVNPGIKVNYGKNFNTTNNATPYNLVEVLLEKGYNWDMNKKESLSMYVFNYPNVDMVQQNGKLLKIYIDRIVDKVKSSNNASWQGGIFKTWQDMNNSSPNFQFDMIGHSMGGLVSRYYIENEYQENHVRKLVTIDTPHWGSEFATGSVFTDILFYPCDVDLKPTSFLYGSTRVDKGDLSKLNDDYAYAYEYQSIPFVNEHLSSKYYAIAGYDYSDPLPSDFEDQDLYFEVNVLEHSTFSVFYDSIAQGYKQKVGNANSILYPFKMTSTSGDNVVNNQSQLGVNLEFIMGVRMFKTSINIDPFINAIWNPFHSQNQHRKEVCYGIVGYLAE